MDHIESLRLFELAEMSVSIHQPEWDHISDCQDCARAFLVLKGAVEQAMVPTFGLLALEQFISPLKLAMAAIFNLDVM